MNTPAKTISVTGCSFATLYAAAKQYAALGHIPIPVLIPTFTWSENEGKYKKNFCPPFKHTEFTNENWQQKFLQSRKYYNEAKGRDPNALALLCAPTSCFTLDIDNNNNFQQWLSERGHSVPDAPTQFSGSGVGTHYLFEHDSRFDKFNGGETKILLDGVDIDADLRGHGKYNIISYPTRLVADHDSTLVWEYRWAPGKNLLEGAKPSRMPDWLFDAIEPSKKSNSSKRRKLGETSVAKVEDIDEAIAAELRVICKRAFPEINEFTKAKYVGQTIILDVGDERCLMRKKAHKPKHGYIVCTPRSLRYLCHSQKYEECRAGITRPLEVTPMVREIFGISALEAWLNVQTDISDMGIAQWIADEFLKGTVVCTEESTLARGLIWEQFIEEDGIWERRPAAVVLLPTFQKLIEECDALARQYGDELRALKGDKKSEKTPEEHILEFKLKMTTAMKKQCASDAGQRAVRNCLNPMMQERASKIKWDAQPYLVHCANGVYDLEAQSFRKARPEDYSTKSTRLPYKPVAEHDPARLAVIEQYWSGVTLDDNDLKHFLWSAMVTSLIGLNLAQFFLFIVGDGCNGKSFLQKLLRHVTGDYGVCLPSKLLTSPPPDPSKSDPARMMLRGARAGVSPDMAEDRANAATLMNIGGSDTISARGHFQGQQEFDLFITLWISTNRPPDVDQKTDGFTRKVCCVPFRAKFVHGTPSKAYERKRDDNLETRLQECADVMLAVILEHYSFYAKTGLASWPKSVKKATAQYLNSQDPGSVFMNECIKAAVTEGDGADGISVFDAKTKFRQWCDGPHQNVPFKASSQMMEQFIRNMDEKYPPGTEERKITIWKKTAREKTVRGWKCSWKTESERETDEGEKNRIVHSPLSP